MTGGYFVFIGTDVTHTELTVWIMTLAKMRKVTVTDIRYFGSRRYGVPRDNSDIDVYVTTPKGKKHLGEGVIFTEIFRKGDNKYQIEFHAYEDWSDGYVPTHLIGDSCKNELKPITQAEKSK